MSIGPILNKSSQCESVESETPLAFNIAAEQQSTDAATDIQNSESMSHQMVDSQIEGSSPTDDDEENNQKRAFDSEMSSSDLTSNLDFLKNSSVCIVAFEDECTEVLFNYCHEAGAVIVENIERSVDYLIVPVNMYSLDGVCVKPKNTVNAQWLVSIDSYFSIY